MAAKAMRAIAHGGNGNDESKPSLAPPKGATDCWQD